MGKNKVSLKLNNAYKVQRLDPYTGLGQHMMVDVHQRLHLQDQDLPLMTVIHLSKAATCHSHSPVPFCLMEKAETESELQCDQISPQSTKCICGK